MVGRFRDWGARMLQGLVAADLGITKWLAYGTIILGKLVFACEGVVACEDCPREGRMTKTELDN